MKHSVQTNEVQKKYKLLRDKLRDETGLPLAIAMVLAGVDQMLQLRQSPATVRELVERAITIGGSSRIVMPKPDEVAKLLGEIHSDGE